MVNEKDNIKLIAAPYTPMKADGSLNPDLVDPYAEKMRSDGLDGVFVCGTSGEGVLLTPRERKIIAERWAANTGNDFRLYVHVGSSSYVHSRELARHAQEIGAYAISTIGPGPLTPGRIDELLDYCEKVASAAPGLHFYYYHMPALSHIDLPMVDFLMAAGDRIPNLRGIKFTDSNLFDMLECARLQDGSFEILNGYDEMLLAGLAMGASGAVGSTYNYMSCVYKKIIADFSCGNLEEARKWQLFAACYVRTLNRYGGALTAGKTMLSQWGLDLGPCRTPVRNLTGKEKQSFLGELEKMKFFEIVNNFKDSDDLVSLYDQFAGILSNTSDR
jgi:N-acetylneuraminate lyase